MEGLPSRKKVISCKRNDKVKYNVNRTVDKPKATAVINEFSRQKGVDCDQVFSSITRKLTIRILLSLPVGSSMKQAQLDVSISFLHGNLK